MERIDAIRKIMPECAISTDVITGFCGETEEQHQETLSMMDYAKYEFAYMFKYSERLKTLAERKYEDDIPEEIKSRRLTEIINKQNQHSLEANQQSVGKVFKVLVEKPSKKSAEDMCGRNSRNAMIIFPKGNTKPGDYVNVKVNSCTSASLIGEIVA